MCICKENKRRRMQKITKIIYRKKKGGREEVEIKEVYLSKTYNSNDGDDALHVYDRDVHTF